MITRLSILTLLIAGLLLTACRKQPQPTPSPTPPLTIDNQQLTIDNSLLPSPTPPLTIDNQQLTIDNSPLPTLTPITGNLFDLNRYRFRTAQLADDALFAADYETALTLYRQVIEDDTLLLWSPALFALEPAAWHANPHLPDLTDPNERHRLTAYAYYRLMVVHAAKTDPRRVLLTYEVLTGTYTPDSAGYPYAQLGTEFWWRYQVHQDVAFSCSRARRYTDYHPDTILGPLGPAVYGRFGRSYTRDDICPFW